MNKIYYKLFTKKKSSILFLFCLISSCTFGQLEVKEKKENSNQAATIKSIYEEALKNPQGYVWLDYICNKIGSRLSGSEGAAKAVEYTAKVMREIGAEVTLQKVMVPHWVRGEKEIGKILTKKGETEFAICALGNSVGTGNEGLKAQVVEVRSFDELKSLGESKIKGKIVFYNYKMDVTEIETFNAYGKAGEYRFNGSSEAAKYGAVGSIVRSLTTLVDNNPHTGSMRYQANLPKIPAIAISTMGADLLSKQLIEEPDAQFYFKTTCQMLEDVESFNVIAEIKGSEFPNEIIVVGGHLDSWDLAQGAHDDGAGCVQAMEVLRLFKTLKLQPKRTIRVVLFMNEENGLRGGLEYAKVAQSNTNQKHIVAIESDSGGFTPRGFTVDNGDDYLLKMQPWVDLLSPYHIGKIEKGYGGADISPLKNQGVILIGFRPDSQRYFDYHHTPIDTFDSVNLRELQLGASAITSLIFLIDQNGL